MTVTLYEIKYRARITKVKKTAHVLARNKAGAKSGLSHKEPNPIIHSVDAVREVEVNDNLLLPYVLKTWWEEW